MGFSDVPRDYRVLRYVMRMLRKQARKKLQGSRRHKASKSPTSNVKRQTINKRFQGKMRTTIDSSDRSISQLDNENDFSKIDPLNEPLLTARTTAAPPADGGDSPREKSFPIMVRLKCIKKSMRSFNIAHNYQCFYLIFTS